MAFIRGIEIEKGMGINTHPFQVYNLIIQTGKIHMDYPSDYLALGYCECYIRSIHIHYVSLNLIHKL